jgi:hypothetical protein
MAKGSIYQEALDDIQIGMITGESRDEIRHGVDKVAAEGAVYAKTLSPVGVDRDAAPGTFKESIISQQIPDKQAKGSPVPLPAAQIYSDAVEPDGHHYSQYVEYGSRGYKGAGVFGATQKYIQKQVNE